VPQPGQSALILPVPAADPVLDAVRGRVPGLVRDVPAHVSVLYPFLPADQLTDEVVTRLGEVFAGCAPIPVEFRELVVAGGFSYLPPEPAAPLDALIAAVRALWPAVLRYGGAHGDAPAHLTVAMGLDAGTEPLVRDAVTPLLPVRADLADAWLVVFTDRWFPRATFPFAR
jgi:hypothetical protein